jgi:hypothetical protein
MTLRRVCKVLTIGLLAGALIACGYLANESPAPAHAGQPPATR